MEDQQTPVNRKRLRTLWLVLFIPVAVGIHHFYFKSAASNPQPLPLILNDQTPSVSVSEAELIQKLKDIVAASPDNASRREAINDLISRADQTIADTEPLLPALNSDIQRIPTEETRQLREQIKTLHNTHL